MQQGLIAHDEPRQCPCILGVDQTVVDREQPPIDKVVECCGHLLCGEAPWPRWLSNVQKGPASAQVLAGGISKLDLRPRPADQHFDSAGVGSVATCSGKHTFKR